MLVVFFRLVVFLELLGRISSNVLKFVFVNFLLIVVFNLLSLLFFVGELFLSWWIVFRILEGVLWFSDNLISFFLLFV